MAEALIKVSSDKTEVPLADTASLFEFLKMSTPVGLRGPALEKRLLTSLTIALRQRSEAH